jgi:glycosyltransferase involved in cell wall biosynthesis
MPNFLVYSALIPKLFGTKVILDIHDLMPEIFSVKFKLPITHTLIKMLYLEERLSAKFANEIIATNKFHVQRFKDNGITNKNITEVVNVADEEIFYQPNDKDYNQEKLIIVYPSTLAKRLGIDSLIEAVELLKNRNILCLLKIYGDGEYRIQISNIIKEKELNEYIELSSSFVSLEKLSQELDNALIGVIPLPSNLSNDIAMPVKIYEFFAKKVCVVATDLHLLKECFNSSVLFYQESNSKDLADKIEYLYHNREILKDYAEKGYTKFSNRTWDFYKERYKSLLK